MIDTPSPHKLERVLSLAMATLHELRSEHGQIIETDDETMTALRDENQDVDSILRALALGAIEAKALAEMQAQRIADLETRRRRSQNREKSCRNTLIACMEAIGIRTHPDPEFTLSLTQTTPKLIITDPTAIPEDYQQVEFVSTPDKAAIKDALKQGLAVEGATLSNGGPSLQIRTK